MSAIRSSQNIIVLLLLEKEPNELRCLAKDLAGWLAIDSESGVTAIEYGLIASLIALAIIGGVTLTGTHLAAVFNYIAPKLAAP
jgi:pilus assembly protein Flp/PilA